MMLLRIGFAGRLLVLCMLALGVMVQPASASEMAKESISVLGVERHYLAQLPSTTSAAERSLILLLHGHGGSAAQLVGLNDRTAPFKPWIPIAEREQAVLIAADGTIGPDGKQGWNDLRGVAGNPSTDDLAFIRALITRAVQQQGVAHKKVYIVGISNGGHMALRVALQAPEIVAGIGVVAAAMPAGIELPQLRESVSVALMNGTRDRLMPFRGGKMARGRGVVLSTNDSTEFWVRSNQCQQPGQTKRYDNLSRKDRSRVVRTLYQQCESGAKVAMFEVRGAGHSTPSVSERYKRGYLLLTGRQNWDIESADEIWNVIR